MEAMREQLDKHREKYGVVWLAATASALVAFGGNTFAVYKAWDSKADKEYVQATLREYDAQISTRYSGLENKIDRILVNQIRAELMELYEQRCTTGSRAFDDTIRRLEDEYRLLTGSEFRRPSCGEFS